MAAAGLAPGDVADGSRIGFVHSAETTSGVNGPGLRYTVFLSGCPLRCLYCHNPDTQTMRLGERTTARRVIEEAGALPGRSSSRGGGLTVTGGEPLLQPAFVEDLFVGVKDAYGLHTALDTSGQRRAPGQRAAAGEHRPGPAGHQGRQRRALRAGQRRGQLRRRARLRRAAGRPPDRGLDPVRAGAGPDRWSRTRSPRSADLAADLGEIVDRVEVLPYHRLGVDKYAALGRAYPLLGTPTPTRESVDQALAIFRDRGLYALA